MAGWWVRIGRTYRASALLFRTANFEIWQARYTWVFLQFCVDSDEKLDCMRIRGALDLRGTIGFFASIESVTNLNKKESIFPYYSFPWRVDGDGAVKRIRFSEFMWTENDHKRRAAFRYDNGHFIFLLRCWHAAHSETTI